MKISQTDKIGLVLRGGPVNGPFAAAVSLTIRQIFADRGLVVHGIYANSGSVPAGVMAAIGEEASCCTTWEALTPRDIIGLKSWFQKAWDVLRSPSIYQNEPLRRVLSRVVPLQRVFAEDAIAMKFMTVDYTRGEPVVFSNKNPQHYRSWISGMLGSMALTPFFPPVSVGQRLLLDGGYFDNLMLDEACRDGMTVLLVVDINELTVGPLETPVVRHWADPLQRAFHVLILTNDQRRLHGVRRTNEILTIREELRGIANAAPDELRHRLDEVVSHMHFGMLDLENKHPVQIVVIGDRQHAIPFDFSNFIPEEVGYLLEAGAQSARQALATLEVV